jgi:hypothetical protein
MVLLVPVVLAVLILSVLATLPYRRILGKLRQLLVSLVLSVLLLDLARVDFFALLVPEIEAVRNVVALAPNG